MSSFSCPHCDMALEFCLRLRTDCVPGRPGCVLANCVFAVPAEERIRAKEEAKRRSQDNERGKPPADIARGEASGGYPRTRGA
jgi:hypothetical protein